jgi:hypothetical protein
MFHRLLVSLLLLAAYLLPVPKSSVHAAEEKLCFSETGFCISGRFRQYWEQNGGLPVFGFPTSEPFAYTDPDTGQASIQQWFERNRFELHPENKAPYDVLLGRLGDELLLFANVDWQGAPRESGPQSGCVWFEQTGRNVCDQAAGVGFKTYWQTHGLEFDGKPGKTYQESLALFGLPLTSIKMEKNVSGDTVLTQWFERARFEYHPNKPNEYKVLLGLLGNEYPVEDETPPDPQPSAPPAEACAGIPAPRLAVIEPNCVRQGEEFLVVVYDFEPNEEISYWITKQGGGTIGGNQTVQVDENGEFGGSISTADWEMPPGDYVFVAQDSKARKEPSTAPFRVLP